MPKYRYTAVDMQNRWVSGEIEATGTDAAMAQLAASPGGLSGICLGEIDAPTRRGGWLSTEEAIELARGLADLTRSGLPLAGGLAALSRELSGIRLPRLVGAMALELEGGATLDDALAAVGDRFPAHLRGLVLAGLRSGRLAEVLEEFVDIERARIELRRRVWLSMAYPTLLLLFVAAVMVFLCAVIGPQFVKIYDDFDTELPVMTKLFVKVIGPGTAYLGIGMLLLALAIFALTCVPTMTWGPRILYRVPLVGPLWRYGRLVQFTRLVGLLLEQEVPLPDALRLAAAGLPDACLAEASRRLAEGVEEGRPLAECVASQRLFPPTMVPLVEWGQRTEAMAGAFRASSEMFEGRVNTQGIALEAIMLPLMLLLVVTFVGFFIIAMFLPLFSLVQSLW